SGNIYMVGNFRSPTISFGSITLVNDSNGFEDIFFVKYNPSGNVIWAKQIGGKFDDDATFITSDAHGIYLTGSFSSKNIFFGSTTLYNDTTNSSADVFTIKCDTSGTIIWAKSGGGKKADKGVSITTSNSGVYVTGSFISSTCSFGSTTLIHDTTKNNTTDIFTVKYDINGNLLWAKSAGGGNTDEALCIKADTLGRVYVTGYFISSKLFVDLTTLIHDTVNNGTSDVFTLSYDASGNLLWAKSAGGKYADAGASVSIDNVGIYITGSFNSPTIDFGTNVLTNSGNLGDIFLTKYDINGNVIWTKSMGGSGDDQGTSIFSDFSGICITGRFTSPIITFGSTAVTNVGSYDIYVLKCDTSGNPIWATSAGGNGVDLPLSVSTYGSEIYVTGIFSTPSINFGSNTLNNVAYYDPFIAKLDETAGINKYENNITVKVYPNPTNGNFLIETTTSEKQNINVYDVNGKLVLTQNINGRSNIDASNLLQGVYNISITGNSGITNKCLVIVK
ncbi:MAG: T9SS type A sorting domain-containing protein, partial [Bacteroidia bacterium]